MLTKEMTLTLILPHMDYSYQGISKQLACVEIYLAVVWAVSLCPQACHDIIINMKIGSKRGTTLYHSILHYCLQALIYKNQCLLGINK